MIIPNTYFDTAQITLISIGAFFFLISLVSHTVNKGKFTFISLGLTALFVFSFAALLDPFLNMWDERFHALVAKNLMNHPLLPTLYDDPVVNMAYDRWDKYHIWLHKQPLFLWQIALSFKIFGISEFSLRIPSLILGTILVLITYRCGKLVANDRVGYIASVLLISSIFIIELIGGWQTGEHNDVAFIVYVSLSIWSFIEYYYSKNLKWIYLIGLFSGMAILCKWLVGFLVYFGWMILKILQRKNRPWFYKDIIWSLIVTIIIALPWQIFTFIKYPEEASNAYRLNALHSTIPIDGHGGNFWYHFDKLSILYGTIAYFLILPGMFFLVKRSKDKNLIFSLLSMVIVVYLFFSFAATKMPSFTLVVIIPILVSLASFWDYLLEYFTKLLKKKTLVKLIFIVSIIAALLYRFDIEYLQEKHTFWKETNTYSRSMVFNKKVYQSLDLPNGTVIFNQKNSSRLCLGVKRKVKKT